MSIRVMIVMITNFQEGIKYTICYKGYPGISEADG